MGLAVSVKRRYACEHEKLSKAEHRLSVSRWSPHDR
jgi:hypothetical protein